MCISSCQINNKSRKKLAQVWLARRIVDTNELMNPLGNNVLWIANVDYSIAENNNINCRECFPCVNIIPDL